MLYSYDYSLVSDCHVYKFKTIPISLNLSPAHFTIVDIDPDLNIYTVDIVKKDKIKSNHNIGQTVAKILKEFIDNNKQCVVGYYPSSKDNKDKARISLFEKWLNKYVETNNLLGIKIIISFMGNEEMLLQLFMNDKYPNQDKLVAEMNNLSKRISEK